MAHLENVSSDTIRSELIPKEKESIFVVSGWHIPCRAQDVRAIITWDNMNQEDKLPQHDWREALDVLWKIIMKEGNQHFQYQKSGAIGAVIVSVIVFLVFHILHSKKILQWNNLQLYFFVLLSTP